MPPTNWQRFFDAHAHHYEQNKFTQNTLAEVDFFLSLFPLAKGSRVVDVGCGTGRHSIELAKRGFNVTGLDISEGMLQVAETNAAQAGVQVQWVHGDAMAFRFKEPFDGALCVCEGAFGLIGAEDDPRSTTLKSSFARQSLETRRRISLTALNGYGAIRRFTNENVAHGAFDPATMVAEYEDEWDLPEGKTTLVVRERSSSPRSNAYDARGGLSSRRDLRRHRRKLGKTIFSAR